LVYKRHKGGKKKGSKVPGNEISGKERFAVGTRRALEREEGETKSKIFKP